MKSEYHIQKSIIIKSHPEKIYTSISDLNKLAQWSALIGMKPENEVFVSENTLYWKEKGSNVNLGEIEVINKELNTSVQLNVKIADYQSIQQPVYSIEKKEDGTQVTVTDNGNIPYFMRYFAIEEAVATQYQKGLESLKKFTE